MTIGIGIRCRDGIVLCADTQMTCEGQYKTYDCKIYTTQIQGLGWVCFTYAGDPNLMDMFYGKFCRIINSKIYIPSIHALRQTLEDVLDDMQSAFAGDYATGGGGLSTLCAASIQSDGVALFKTNYQKVTDVKSKDYIGAGDTSLLRYLCKIYFDVPDLTTDFGVLMGTYLVTQAKTFIDGCGGETDIQVLLPEGKLVLKSGNALTYEQRLLGTQYWLSRVMAGVFDPDVSVQEKNEELDSHLERLGKALKDLSIW